MISVDLGFGVLVVRDVPAHVCSQCGEEWLEDNVNEKLEQFTQEAKRKHLNIEVVRRYWINETTSSSNS